MGGICGYVGTGDPAWLPAMLAAIGYRGDQTDLRSGPGFGIGVRGRGPARVHDTADGGWLACAGGTTTAATEAAIDLERRLAAKDFSDLDGAFAAARWHPDGALTLLRDPFGVRSLYYVTHGRALLFASELKQLLAVPDLPCDLDLAAIHKYLTFSFVPGEAVPVRGVRRLLPGHLLHWQDGTHTVTPWFALEESVPPGVVDEKAAARDVFQLGQAAVQRRLQAGPQGVYLSGGLDSSAVALWLQRAGADVRAFSLDFGDKSVEREHAEEVARVLGLPLQWVPMTGAELPHLLTDLVRWLDLPFGDTVTAPQLLLGRAARAAGLRQVWNGEGGDQLFGGWTQKPMLAAAVYGDEDEEPEAQYLRSYHRFYGLEDELYTPEFHAAVGTPGQRRALLRPYLADPDVPGFLGRVRRADLALKGSQNILPRAERIAAGLGLDVQMPFLDRLLAEASFRMPPSLKLHGACEKYVLKLALAKHLPKDIVWRRKFGMNAPATDWLLGPLQPVLDDALGEASVKRRGLFRPEYIARLRAGHDQPLETRRRRIGEKLWALLMVELWLRAFVDRRGRP